MKASDMDECPDGKYRNYIVCMSFCGELDRLYMLVSAKCRYDALMMSLVHARSHELSRDNFVTHLSCLWTQTYKNESVVGDIMLCRPFKTLMDAYENMKHEGDFK